MGSKTRVLVVYGSESGNAKRGIDRILKKWKALPSLRPGEVEVGEIIGTLELPVT